MLRPLLSLPLPLPGGIFDSGMPAVCAQDNSVACATVYDWTGNSGLARAATWAIGVPLKVLLILLLGLFARWVATRMIVPVLANRLIRWRPMNPDPPKTVATRYRKDIAFSKT